MDYISFLDQLLQTKNFPECRLIILNVLKDNFFEAIETGFNENDVVLFNANVIYVRETLLRLDNSIVSDTILDFIALGKQSQILNKLMDNTKFGTIDRSITVNIYKLFNTMITQKISVSLFSFE